MKPILRRIIVGAFLLKGAQFLHSVSKEYKKNSKFFMPLNPDMAKTNEEADVKIIKDIISKHEPFLQDLTLRDKNIATKKEKDVRFDACELSTLTTGKETKDGLPNIQGYYKFFLIDEMLSIRYIGGSSSGYVDFAICNVTPYNIENTECLMLHNINEYFSEFIKEESFLAYSIQKNPVDGRLCIFNDNNNSFIPIFNDSNNSFIRFS